MLNYVECKMEERKAVISETKKFNTLKEILKTYSDDIGSKLSLLADDSICNCGLTKIVVNNDFFIHIISLSVENPLLAAETATLTVCASFVEDGIERMFAEYIFLNNKQLSEFRHIIRTLSAFACVKKRKPAKRAIDNSNKQLPRVKRRLKQ